MAKNYHDITLALAGICQAARLAQQVAHEGRADATAMHSSIHSLMEINPPSVLAVYGSDTRALKMGMETLLCVLSTQHQQSGAELVRYTFGIMLLERRLHAQKSARSALTEKIADLERKRAHFDLGSEQIFSALAALYVDIISPLGPRIQVTGSPLLLQNTQLQNKIRAFLLAGISSAVLWQQLGGGRLQLILCRNRLLRQAQSSLDAMK